MLLPLCACLALLLTLGIAERRARDAAWRDVPLRIHVNGTRGKSTVTRLIWAALVEAGIPAIAKTTGTAARVLLPNRTEQPWHRRGPANIREQLAFLRVARQSGARAAVIECMAVEPALQYVCERHIVHSTVGVITNVRRDHTDVMGASLEHVAASLANTVPTGGVLVHGCPEWARLFSSRADALGTRVVEVGPAGVAATSWLDEDRATARAVCESLGLDHAVITRGFDRAPLDPGALREGATTVNAATIRWVDATAANDPDSFNQLLGSADDHDVVVYNHRADRCPRLATFATDAPLLSRAAQLLVTGERPPLTVWRLLRGIRAGRPLRFVRTPDLSAAIGGGRRDLRVVFCGNTKGLDVASLMQEMDRRD